MHRIAAITSTISVNTGCYERLEMSVKPMLLRLKTRELGEIKAVVDTGSTCNAVSEGVMCTLDPAWRIKMTRQKEAETASGSIILKDYIEL